ncbi:hypothetical protein RN001_012116 [Aquatica leii]|uniref:Zinc finger MYM-type protein 1-like n=1 Tax=Aquatica leii TaxID=1421715 RepID=A0AAN7P2J9_9COLE|nr:hypothetical protein RN001_012116 [Aquatica leii]
MDVIFKLSETKFHKLTYQEQLAIKDQGRPKPKLKIEVAGKSRGKTYLRQFNMDVYSRNNWICGCNQKDALFCFPCVLFADDRGEKIWTETGVKDLVHLSEKIKKHENSKTHIGNEIRFALFGKINIQAQLDSAYWVNIQKHNEEVTKNRYILTKIINCIKFCGAFELALRGHDEKETSENPGIFRGLVNFSSELDRTLEEHLKNASIFKGTSKSIQNDILDCMLELCHEEIIQEINKTPFLAVMADETTDVSAKFQMVTIFRYVTKDGDPVERFWNFLLPMKHDAKTLSETILGVIDPILKNENQKLIAQTYDGAAVMSVFFGDLNEIPAFFSHSPQRVAVLDQIVGRKMPRSIPTRWNFNIRTVNIVYEYRDCIIECMEQLKDDSNALTCRQASGIRRILQDSNFTFWLTFFHHAMPHVDVLYNQLQKRNIDPTEAQRVISVFEQNINSVRNKIDSIILEASNFDTLSIGAKRKQRFEFTNHLIAASLIISEKFVQYHNKFPENELDITYLRGAVPFLKFIISNNLEETMGETKKLLQILVTTPMTTTEAERSFSTLKRIKTFLRNSMCEDRLTALSMLSIEKKFIAEIPNFNEKVIDKFAAKKDRRIPLIIKKLQ